MTVPKKTSYEMLLKRNKEAFLKDLILQLKINGEPQSKGK